jgi:hypothetical protein
MFSSNQKSKQPEAENSRFLQRAPTAIGSAAAP